MISFCEDGDWGEAAAHNCHREVPVDVALAGPSRALFDGELAILCRCPPMNQGSRKGEVGSEKACALVSL